jgi:hypothetical protein
LILISARSDDAHAVRVADLLRKKGHAVSFVHGAEFGTSWSLSFDPCTGYGVIRMGNNMRIDACDVLSVWYRRPGRPMIDDKITNPFDRRFTETEWQSAVDGFFSLLPSRVISPPFCQRAAIKPRQLSAARCAGLRVPDTLITNDIDEAREFVESHGLVIHKAMSSPAHRFLDTRSWGKREEESLNDLPLCPTILQEQIQGPSDVRATIVGNRIFAARIDTAQSRAGLDSRLDLDVPCTTHVLPDVVSTSLFKVMDHLGLLFGTVDLKLTHSNEYVFFEINPQGQFLYIEILTGQPISASVAELLECPPEKSS